MVDPILVVLTNILVSPNQSHWLLVEQYNCLIQYKLCLLPNMLIITIIVLYVYYYTFLSWCPYCHTITVIHIRRDGMWFTYISNICYNQRYSGSDTRQHTRMFSANFGRSQGARRMPSAFARKIMIVLLVIVGQIKHCENVSTCNETFMFIAR